jgi:Zn-finger protein
LARSDLCPRCKRVVEISIEGPIDVQNPIWDAEKCTWVHNRCQQIILSQKIEAAKKKARKGTLTIEEAEQAKEAEAELQWLKERNTESKVTKRIGSVMSSISPIFSNRDPRFVDIGALSIQARKGSRNILEQDRIRARKRIEEGLKRLALTKPHIMMRLGYPGEVIKQLADGEGIKMLPPAELGNYHSPYARFVRGEITSEEMRALEEQDDIAGRKRKWITEAK